jgi:hypothetical protein
VAPAEGGTPDRATRAAREALPPQPEPVQGQGAEQAAAPGGGLEERAKAARGLAEQGSEAPTAQAATINVLLPDAGADLLVGGAGRANPDERSGPWRVIRTPPLERGAECLVVAVWTDRAGRRRTRTHDLQVEPGRTYEVDLGPRVPTCRETTRSYPGQ